MGKTRWRDVSVLDSKKNFLAIRVSEYNLSLRLRLPGRLGSIFMSGIWGKQHTMDSIFNANGRLIRYPELRSAVAERISLEMTDPEARRRGVPQSKADDVLPA
jgi:hypothetical protein